MLNSLLGAGVGAWFAHDDCPAKPILDYIQKRGKLRPPQVEAIKTYLYLKIVGQNRPLHELFCEGFFLQSEDLSRLHISEEARKRFESDPAARSLYGFARMKPNGGAKILLPELEKYLLDHAAELKCNDVVKQMFYGVEYPDYLFSLPMGAGKTYLMAAFLYLDLYFAQNEPDNNVFAHNFLLLVPSGLKSSIIPSLRTIENFDPTWVLPEPAASNLRKLIKFEILDQPKTAKKSNKARNPNAQKLSQHQPFEDLIGLVMVTNAEKVVLDQLKTDAQGKLDLSDETEDEKDRAANELRNLISKVPNLQILIDEVHHAATDDIKLRQVVNAWSAGKDGNAGNINGVLGFSGTPYLASAEEVKVADGVAVKFSQIANTVFYYPLTKAIAEFLKKPNVRLVTGLEPGGIVRRGVQEFLGEYGAKLYENGTTAKLAIYCGSIERLEEEVYPLLIGEMGFAPEDILKYHRGNTKYKISAGDERAWRFLNDASSKKRIILLVQIGKEGWDCPSLTGVILSQKGDCPTNMVLQTSCRCLRQMDGNKAEIKTSELETAGIWLNPDNAKSLDKQLKEEQNTSIEEINRIGQAGTVPTRPRYSRMDPLKLPPVEFYQLRVQHSTRLLEGQPEPGETLEALDPSGFHTKALTIERSLTSAEVTERRFHTEERGELADYGAWTLHIAKGSFGKLTTADLRPYDASLRAIFGAITYTDRDELRYNTLYDAEEIAAQIRLAFYAKRELETQEEILPVTARLLVVEKLSAIAASARNLYPNEADTEQILTLDRENKSAEELAQTQREEFEAARKALEALGMNTGLLAQPDTAELSAAVKNKDRSFQFLPYNFDSLFELKFLQDALTLKELRDRNLELYFNGAGELTEFRIECFAKNKAGWSKVGKYTPDFLLVERRDGQIYRALIIETKGSGFAEQSAFLARRKFVETEFLKRNAEQFGYARFDYLYLKDEDPMETNLHKLVERAKLFFTE